MNGYYPAPPHRHFDRPGKRDTGKRSQKGHKKVALEVASGQPNLLGSCLARRSRVRSPIPLITETTTGKLSRKAGLHVFSAPIIAHGIDKGASQAAGAAPTLRYGPAGDSAPRLRLKFRSCSNSSLWDA